MKITLALVLAAAVAGGIAGAAAGLAFDGNNSHSTRGTTSSSASQRTSSARTTTLTPEQIYRRAAPGVVVITDTQTEQITPGLHAKVTALGSGFVIDQKGDIVTNDHVVQGATGIRVGFSSGATYRAKVVGSDASTDVAVVRVQAPKSVLHPLAWADSAAVTVGDPAYAIGNPFGLDRTMTAGIVSATGRDIQAPNGLTIPNAIQTDAPINHGNSGGPLLDGFARVIGINDQIQGGTVDGNVGIGFAVPSDTAKRIAEELIQSGRVRHAWLGVEGVTIDATVARQMRGLPTRGVAVVRVVKGSPAAKAGLRARDAIVAVAGKPVGSSQQLGVAIAARRPGDHVQLGVVRNGQRRAVTVTLGDAPTSTP